MMSYTFYFFFPMNLVCFLIQALVSPFLLDDSVEDMNETYLSDPPGKFLFNALKLLSVQFITSFILSFSIIIRDYTVG